MRNSTQDRIAGKARELKGKLKEKAGRAMNNPELEDEGRIEKGAGKVRKKIGQVERVFERD